MRVVNWITAAGLFVAVASAEAAQIFVPSAGQGQAVLGTGYRVNEDSWAEECVKGRVTYTGRQESNLSFSSTIAHSMLEKELGFEAGYRAKWGVAKASASASFLNTSKESSHSIVAVYKGDYTMKSQYLTDVQENAIDPNNKRLKPDCGEAYVKAIGRGAKLFFSIRIDFVSEEQKRKFAAAASYSNATFAISAAIKDNKNSFDTRSRVTVQAYQLGGDVRQLSHVFGPQTQMVGDGGTTGEAPKPLAIVRCTFGNYDACDEALNNALVYAQHQFPEQLKTNENNPDLGPANLYYVLQPYEGHSPAVDEALRGHRQILEDILNEQTEILRLAHNATTNRVYPLAPDQQMEAKEILNTAMENISALTTLADQCYNHIGTCERNARAAREVLKEITNKRVYFPPKSFLQYCGIGYYLDPDQDRHLHETILTMIAVAKRINPALFGAETNQGLNNCEAAYDVLKKQTKFDISLLRNEMGTWSVSSRVYLLDPFIDLNHFVEVDLSGQRLADMSKVTFFKRATKIDLSDNELDRVTDLSMMDELTDLDVSGNRLRTVDGIGMPRNLVRLDVRNNILDLECPPIETLRVCIQKSYIGRIGASIVGSDLPRAMVQPAVTRLKDGRIYMSSGRDTIIYNPRTHERFIAAPMRYPRRSHTATLLDDGRVLVVGGIGGQNSVEIYDPAQNKYELVTQHAPNRVEHAAVKLKDGRILISGGYDTESWEFSYRPTQTLSIFDPSSGKFESVGHMRLARAAHTLTLLPDGRVLIVGGYFKNGGQRLTEIFDPETCESKPYVPLNEGRYGHTTTILPDGKILVAGGLEKEGKAIRTLEYLDPRERVFKLAYEKMKTPRAFHTAVLVESGQVIFAGGANTHYGLLVDDGAAAANSTPQIEVYTPEEESFTDLGRVQLTYPRATHRAVIAEEGMIFVIGGSDAHSGRTMELISYGGLEP